MKENVLRPQLILLEIDRMVQKNQEKFSAIKNLNLPMGEYAITGSGALGIRNLREIGDIDIIVTPQLWEILMKKYGITDENSIQKIVFPGGVVEAFREGSFYAEKKEANAPSVAERIATADIMDELPFESLEHVLYYKQKMNREKDLKDIFLIENCLKEKLPFEIRAFVSDSESIKQKLIHMKAECKGEYAFTDYIYQSQDRKFDLNKEFIRLRVYQKTGWNQKAVELSYKVKNFPQRSGRSLFKEQFNSIDESQIYLTNHSLAFSYFRKGVEYLLEGIRIFVEEVDGLSPSIEVVSETKEELDKILEDLAPNQKTKDSVPKLIERELGD